MIAFLEKVRGEGEESVREMQRGFTRQPLIVLEPPSSITQG